MPVQSGASEHLNGKKGQPLRVLQFTDTHFFGSADGRLMGVDTAMTFRQVLVAAHEEHGAPDFYLLTGDLSQDETGGSYRRFAEATQELNSPAYYLPGNHDARQEMLAAFSTHGQPFRSEESFVFGNWHVILLDTQVVGEVGGHLAASELTRLETALAAHPNLNTLVTLHHHPLPVGSEWIDQIKVSNNAEFLEIIDRHKQVRTVLCGHIHQEFDTMRNGVRYLGTPSTCVQFKPRSQGFAVDALPPGYRWLNLHPDGMVESGVGRVASVAAGLDMASHGY